MAGSKLTCFLVLIVLATYTKVVEATDHVAAIDISTKISLMEKIINSLVQRSREVENKLHTVETQLSDAKIQDEKSREQIQKIQQEKLILETSLKAQIKALQGNDVTLTTKIQQSSEKIQNLQHDKTTLEVKQQVLESQLQQQTGAWKEIKESEAALKAHQSILTARQDNQATILKNIEDKQAGMLSKQKTFESQLKNQEIKLKNHDNNQILFRNKQVEITRHQTWLVGKVTNLTQSIAVLQTKLQNVTQKQVVMETVLQKHADNSEFRLLKLEDTQKNATNRYEIQIATANQKFSEISLNQGSLEQVLKNSNYSSELNRLIQKHAVIQAKKILSDRKIQDLGLKQQVLDHQLASQAAYINKLDTKTMTNLQQVAWTGEGNTDNGIIKTLSFNKKNAVSGLSATFYGTLRVRANSGARCNRWWFELNGLECTNPEKIEGVIYTLDPDDNYKSPSVVSGICHGIPAGNINIVFKVGGCNNSNPLGDAITGWSAASRIIIEEI